MTSVEKLANAIERAGKACGLSSRRVAPTEFDRQKAEDRMRDFREIAEGRVSADVVQARNSVISSAGKIVVLDDSSAYL
jgi:hypothetical protein